VHAVENVNLRVEDREFVCIVGPSGCGKTTLLKMIAGLLAPSSGEIRFDGDGARTAGPRATLVFQEHGVYDWMRVVDNVAFGLETRGVPRRERRGRAREFIDRVGLQQFADAYPRELSVGMRQRVGIARAFLTGSPHLLMDEPFGSLDAQTKIILQQDLLTMWAREGTSILYVTHDIEEAVALGDRVIVMTGRPGRIREDIAVELPRPRGVGPERTADSLPIESHIWTQLKEEVAWQLRAPA
jgi:NitT/TauT family transport system ATP-binding protein